MADSRIMACYWELLGVFSLPMRIPVGLVSVMMLRHNAMHNIWGLQAGRHLSHRGMRGNGFPQPAMHSAYPAGRYVDSVSWGMDLPGTQEIPLLHASQYIGTSILG